MTEGRAGMPAERIAMGLGCLGVTLGLVELSTSRRLARFIHNRNGRDAQALVRAVGATAVTAGLASMAVAEYLAARGAARAYQGTARPARDVQVRVASTVNRTIEDVYAFWRNFKNFPHFMRHVRAVEIVDSTRSRWTVKGPGGTSVSWDAELITEREPDLIEWRTVPEALVSHRGSVRFVRAPGARGTEVHVDLHYSPPAGSFGKGIAWLFGEEPGQQVREDLRRLKQLMEAREIAIAEGAGLWNAARPSEDPAALREPWGVRS